MQPATAGDHGLLRAILPTRVAVAEEFGDVAGAVLFRSEREHIRGAVESRQREFATTRTCARRALAALGHAPVAVPIGTREAPVWPAGVVGSLTHCPGYRAAALAAADDVRSIGIDAEPAEALPSKGVLRLVSDADEREQLSDRAAQFPLVPWDCLLFSAKETCYKVWFPLTTRWLGFDDVDLRLSPPASDSTGTFRAALRVEGPVVDGKVLTELRGRWLIAQGLVLTCAVVLPADQSAFA